jgi:uncharacterized membrane protein
MIRPFLAPAESRFRYAALDVARGLALVAMALYHATWDLGALRLTPENYALTPSGRLAAHGIAGCFLILVGIGLVLMNGERFAAGPFALRLARIAGAALLVTAATVVTDPSSYIFFGILHCIAVSSVLALLFPWFGMVLAGVAMALYGLAAFRRSRLANWTATGRFARGLAWAGRHSLAIYLIHQPILIGLLTGLVSLTGPHPEAGVAEFRALYVRNCVATGGETAACTRAAACVSDAFRRENLWADRPRSFTAEERLRAQGLSQGCYAAAEGTAPAP